MPLSRKRENKLNKLKNAIVNDKKRIPSGITSRMVKNITGSAGIATSQDTPSNGIMGCIVYPTHDVVIVVPGSSAGFSYHPTSCCDVNELSFLEESD